MNRSANLAIVIDRCPRIDDKAVGQPIWECIAW